MIYQVVLQNPLIDSQLHVYTKLFCIFINLDNLIVQVEEDLHCVRLSAYNVHWAWNETYHFFRAMLTKIHDIKINNIWTQISFNTPS